MTDQQSEQDVERPPLRAILGVRYLGSSDERVLTKADLAAVGIRAKRDVVWDASNDHLVPIDALNAATVDYLAGDSAEFMIVEA
jgi:hypothetical protein